MRHMALWMGLTLLGTRERQESSMRIVNHPVITLHSGVCDQAKKRFASFPLCLPLWPQGQTAVTSSGLQQLREKVLQSSAPIKENLIHVVWKVSKQRTSPWSAIQWRNCVADTCKSAESQHQCGNMSKLFKSAWGISAYRRQPAIWLNLGNNATH